jgi:hypothetical protein
MTKKPKPHQITADEMRKAVRAIADSQRYWIPITPKEARFLNRTLNDHLCSRPPEKCQTCKARSWFTQVWDKRFRGLVL